MQPTPEDWTRAVAVVAHPDDLEHGVAAAVARWTGPTAATPWAGGPAGLGSQPPAARRRVLAVA